MSTPKYDYVKVGEVIRDGDEYLDPGDREHRWKPTTNAGRTCNHPRSYRRPRNYVPPPPRPYVAGRQYQ